MRTRTAALVFVVLGLAVFGRSLVPGQLFVPMHTQRLEPWRSDLTAEKSAEFAAGEYAIQSDKLISFRADDQITIDALRHGRLPTWNPTNAGGVSHLGQGLYGVFYPPHWLFALLGPEHAYGWLAFLHHVLAALFTYLWLKKLGAGAAGSLIGGIAFSFSGTLLDRAHYYQYAETVTWLPLGLLCIEHWFDGRRAALFALAPIAGLTALIGWPQIAAYVFNAWAIVVLVKSLRVDLRTRPLILIGAALLSIGLWTAVLPFVDRLIAFAFWPHLALLFVLAAGPGRKAVIEPGAKPRRAFVARLFAFGAVLGLGAAIAAIQYLPMAEWTSMGGRGGPTDPGDICWHAVRPVFALAALVPDLFGTPGWPLLEQIVNLPRLLAFDEPAELSELWRPLLGNILENALYVGVLPLALLALGLAFARGVRATLVTNLVVWFGLAFGVRVLVYPTYFLLPGTQVFNDGRRALVVGALFLCALAAFGVNAIAQRRAAARVVAIALALFGIALIASRWCVSDAALLQPLLDHATTLAQMVGATPGVPPHVEAEVIALLRSSFECAGVVALLSGLALSFATRPSGAMLRMIPLVLVLGADLLVHAWPRTAPQPAAGFLASHALIEHLQASVGASGRLARFTDPARQQGLLGVALSPNLAGCYGLLDAWCYTVSPPKAWTALAAAGFGDAIVAGVALHPLSTSAQLASRALDVMCVKAIIGMGEPPAELPPGIVQDGRFGHAFVLRNERARPRADVVATAIALDGEADWATVARLVLDGVPGEAPVRLGRPGRDAPTLPHPRQVAGTLPSARIAHEIPERVVVELEPGTRDAWLVLRDGYAPGWTATVDGKSADVLPADLAFRAVFVPAGTREVVFSYEPTSVLVGKVVSLFALMLAAILIVLARRRPMPQPASASIAL